MPASAQTQTGREPLSAQIAGEFRPNRLVPSLTMGLVLGAIEVALAVSFAALIFDGELSPFVSGGIGLMLFASMAISVVVALLTSRAGVLGGIQDAPAAILSLVAAAIAVTMPAGASPQETYLTVVAAIVLSSLLTGLFILGLGFVRSGELVRFLPYPVVGGFLAGTGWLLVQGSISVMTDVAPSLSELGSFLELETLSKWLPGLVFALLLIWAMKRSGSALVLPVMLAVVSAVFYLVAWIGGVSISELSAQGWLLGPFPDESLYQPMMPSDLDMVYWPAICEQAGSIATILIVSVVALLLNASGIELVIRKDLDLNRELRVAGIANLVSGLGSGMIGYHSLGTTTLSHRSRVRGRLAGLVVAVVCGLALFVGALVLSLAPRFILGGLLMYLGLSFMIEWVYDAWFKLPKVDYFIVILILVVIAGVGFFQGVAIGIVTAVILFVLNYSRTNVIRYAMSGANFKSRVNREILQRQFLREHGDRLFILQLQGYIFFGTANNLLEQVQRRIAEPEREPPEYVLLDFHRVTGLDTTAMLSFRKMKQSAEANDIKLAFTELSPEALLQFQSEGFVDADEKTAHFFQDLDHGLEWCENQSLGAMGMAIGFQEQTIEDHLASLLPEGADTKTLTSYLEPMVVEAGHTLIRQGDPPDDLYFIEAGQVTAQLEITGREPLRLETMRGGNVVGEIGFYLGRERTASVITDEPSTIYRLTKRDLRRMEETDPEVALAFQQYIIELLAERVAHTVATIDALQR